MTLQEQQKIDRQHRLAGKGIIEEQARSHVCTFLDELRNGTQIYRTVASLSDQVAQEYRGRAILELLQNAHDALASAHEDDPRQIFFALRSSPEPELLVGNSGGPFLRSDFRGICELAQSPKDPNESIGNKGLGFRSVLELSGRPEVWSTAAPGGDTAFTFGFDPDVREPVARIAKALANGEPPINQAFGTEPVVDWSQEQIEKYRIRLSSSDIDPAEEVNKYLSPYVVPRFLDDPPVEVAKLLEDGHVTVIRLPLDGGNTGNAEGAVESVQRQLLALDEAAMVFLRDLSVLHIAIDNEHVRFERHVDPGLSFEAPGTRQRLRVSSSASGESDASERVFHLWGRSVGGDSQPTESERVAAAVRHLPNRWPEVRKVDVAVAVEETPQPKQGVFVIFLPTERETGVGAHINAPFYGSLDRRHINFSDKYNELLLELVLDLILDAVVELVKGPPETWRGRAVVDLLAPAATSLHTAGAASLPDRLHGRALDRSPPLDQLALILCPGRWQPPGVVRTMPAIPEDDPIGRSTWRRQAGFTVASLELEQRRHEVETLVRSLGGEPMPHDQEWAHTLELMAEQINRRHVTVTWDEFMRSLLSILPLKLRSEPKPFATDPLREAGFLPTEDGRVLSAAHDVQIFFRPRGDSDDAADFVGSIPDSLKPWIAFLHPDVKTREGVQRRNTDVQKFLDGRFVQRFRREDLLRRVVIPSLPELPAAHGSPEAKSCSETLAWTLEMIGQEEPESLLRSLARLPVACVNGWFEIREAVFGPGWDGRSGDHLRTLADDLPEEAAEELMGRALLPPNDSAWGVAVSHRADLFARAGVADGLRFETHEPIRFRMSRSHPKLPNDGPAMLPQSAWDDWRNAVQAEMNPEYASEFEYELKGLKALPLFHPTEISDSARRALSNLLLSSLAQWRDGWKEVTVKKRTGWHWSCRLMSPAKHWLSTVPWLDDGGRGAQQPLRRRWLVPESLLQGQEGRFRHLAPLSRELARRLANDPELLQALEKFGLNVYPTEDALIGPDLLEALADTSRTQEAWPAGGFDVLLGQVRHAWRHLDPDRGLPEQFVVRTQPGTLRVRAAIELDDVYLPDHASRTRSLREHRQPILAIRPEDVNQVRDHLQELGARLASGLEERCLIDGRPDTGATDGAQTLHEANLDWLPPVLLTLYAHGGSNPRGPATEAWQQAVRRLHRARLRFCQSIKLELLDAGKVVADSAPRAHWLAREGILLLNWDVAQSALYEETAGALQAMLDRQDLLKDLRLVLGSLAGEHSPTAAQIETAMGRAEIDPEAVADIRLRWSGETSALVERIRPVVKLLDVSNVGLVAAAGDVDRLNAWLSDKIPQWASEEIVAAARESHDDFEMGFQAWQALGEAAELPNWNDALSALGAPHKQVKNAGAADQAKQHLDNAARSLRAFAQHVAMTAEEASEDDRREKIFQETNEAHESIEMDAEWSRLCAKWSHRWWQVPFDAVLETLRVRFEGIAAAKPYLGTFDGVCTILEFNSALERHGVALEPDPLEVARRNQYRLADTIGSVREFYEAWLAIAGVDSAQSQDALQPDLDASMYLSEWSETDLFNRALQATGNPQFLDACAGCTTIEEVRETLDIPGETLERTRKERLRQARKEERKQRTFDVAGRPYEVGGTETYAALFARLKDLPEPSGPRADRDEFTSLEDPPPEPIRPRTKRDAGNEAGPAGRKTAQLYGSPHAAGLVGVVGEMHAFRFLRSRFGIDEHAWVSESRTEVLPLRDGEADVTSDSLGYDFRFSRDGTTWCVEVKSTTENGTSFDLSSGQINVASRLANRKDRRWRILRVRQALTEEPEFDWLPNPFEDGASKRLRLQSGSMTVAYTPAN